MNIKLSAKTLHLLLIIVMLLNPVAVTADTLFIGASSANNMMMSNTTEMQSNCHDKQDLSDVVPTGQHDCCEDICQCSATNCQSPPSTVSVNKPILVSSAYNVNDQLKRYISFVSSPTSPPPIV